MMMAIVTVSTVQSRQHKYIKGAALSDEYEYGSVGYEGSGDTYVERLTCPQIWRVFVCFVLPII